MRKIYAFDFDGTITTRDTMFLFLRGLSGMRKVVYALISEAPFIIMMKLGMYSRHNAKERLLRRFIAGRNILDIDAFCNTLAVRHKDIIRGTAVAEIEKAKAEGAEVVVVTASVENWVKPFLPGITVIGTKLETTPGGIVTGRLSTRNCCGSEKVKRLLELYPDRESYYLAAYGDSSGDRELLEFADEPHYKVF
ncbi:HAD-IB family hydrolase [Xylanibacter muris]|uniref:HAD-IB family hydrolase n=1 Tax=Xylanibacter muris TaxID=2736290 RepID=A0ABX2ALJ3_9BACT|nr:HAD-IB family hydrolase [Xylanibacter muris]NPD91094.1 HAD-IB family hydrolase [Xylanibacter muris]